MFNEIHLKYVNDLTLTEAVDMPLQLAHRDVDVKLCSGADARFWC